jgi:hypothetical protein
MTLQLITACATRASTLDSTPYLLVVKADDTTSITTQADKLLKSPIVTLLNNKAPAPSGNPHDYFSFARYWWPDTSSTSGLPFVRHDGHVNQSQVEQGDNVFLGRMIKNVQTLSVAWSLTHNTAYAARAGDWLRAWFVDPKTNMTPNLEYSQVHLGRNNNHGNNAGVLDGRGFSNLIDALRILRGSEALSSEDDKVINAWFKSYYAWLMTSPLGIGEHNATNNHGSWFLVQAISIARYLGDNQGARALALEDKKRIENQIEPDGKQPLELERTDGLSYSIFNLEAQLYVAQLSKPLGVDLWHYTSPRGGSLSKALEFLKLYNGDPSKWSTNQLKKMHAGFLNEVLSQAALLNKNTT